MTTALTSRSAAVLTIRDAPRMTPRGRRAIAAWLLRQAGALTRDSARYARRFTARYLS